MMTQTTSGLRSFLKYTALVPMFVLLGAFLGCEPSSVDHEDTYNTITITVLDSEEIKLNGKKMPVSELEKNLTQFSQASETVIELSVHPGAPMGVVWDVQQLINKNDRSGDSHSTIKIVEIKVDDAETVRLQDKKVTLQELSKSLVELNGKYDLIINFSTSADGASARIADIQKVIRNSGTFRINYSVAGDAG